MIRDIRTIIDFVKSNIVNGHVFDITIDYYFDIIGYEKNGNRVQSRDSYFYDETVEIYCQIYNENRPNQTLINSKCDIKLLTVQHYLELPNTSATNNIQHDTSRILRHMRQKCDIKTLKELMIKLINLTNDSYSFDTLLKVFGGSNVEIYVSRNKNMRYLMCFLFRYMDLTCNPDAKCSNKIFGVPSATVKNIHIMSFMLFIQLQRIRHMDTIKDTVTFLLSLVESIKIY